MYDGATLANQFNNYFDVKLNNINVNLAQGEEIFRKNLVSVVYYMVKYISTILVKQDYSNSTINILYASPLRILDEEYIKQAFYSPSGSKVSSQIGGRLLNPNTSPNNAWIC
jgi:hypothetical protein